MIKRLKQNLTSSGGFYVASGMFKTASITISGIVVLKWLNPEELGYWQSFLVGVGYIQILTLGTTSGLNREIAFLIGKNKLDEAIERLKTVGYFTRLLSFILMLLVGLIAIILYSLGKYNIQDGILFFLAFGTGALTIQTNFLGATFRSSSSFKVLGKVQFFVSLLYFLLLPLVLFFGLWGFVFYQVILSFSLYLGYYLYRPYKVNYEFNKQYLFEIIKTGLPMYIWNYLASISRSIPRLILATYGGPIALGLYSPAGSINNAFMSLPLYVNRFLFPKMSYIFGNTGDKKKVYDFTMNSAWKLLLLMLLLSIGVILFIPYVIEYFFNNYSKGIAAIQITLISGVFYSVNTMIHNAINSLKVYNVFKWIILYRFIFVVLFTWVGYYFFNSILIAVSIGSLVSEVLNFLNYWKSFYKITRN